MYTHRSRKSNTTGNNWAFREGTVFLNHGSFGACPLPVIAERENLLRWIESDPMEFILSEYFPLQTSALNRVEQFTGAEPGSIVFVQNSTVGINTILRNLPVKPGDGILVTDHEYFASMNSLRVHAKHRGASVQLINLPFPVVSEEEILSAVADSVTPSTKYALIDHIVSSTGMILPLKRIIDLLSGMGIKTVVDGAHGPGQVPLCLKELGCFAYVGNCHKWICSPRSAAILYVNPDFQKDFLPLSISHLPEEFETDLSPFQIYFSWNGTPDPTPVLLVPYTLDFMEGLNSEGWPGIMKENREKALAARAVICSTLETDFPCPDSMVGSMACIPLEGYRPVVSRKTDAMDPLQRWLKHEKGIVVPVTETGDGKRRLIRISAQLYNDPEQYNYLAEALVEFRKSMYNE